MMKQYTFEQLKDPKVRIEIYEQALKDWRTPWIFRNDLVHDKTLGGFGCYFRFNFNYDEEKTQFLLWSELAWIGNMHPVRHWFVEHGQTRKGRRARRKALRKAIKICKQKIKSNEQFS